MIRVNYSHGMDKRLSIKQMNIIWFRQDLRVADNPALSAAVEAGDILPIYILDDENSGRHQMGAASRVWLYDALTDLNKSLDGHLRVFTGDARTVIKNICAAHDVKGVYWNRCYEPWRISRDKSIKEDLADQDIDMHSFNGSLLWEPWNALKKDGTPYKVFTPYYRRGCLNLDAPREPLSTPDAITFCDVPLDSSSIEDLNLLPEINWDDSIKSNWTMSEKGAHDTLDLFMEKGVRDYKEGRNFPAKKCVSQLSPYLHFGQISPNQIWYETLNYDPDKNIDHFQSELGWREFSNNLLYHFPQLPTENLQDKFDRFPWREDDAHLKAWQHGKTGYPIVDAGMRELWQTGYMHNRVRMIVGSFLVKNLMLHWHHGERWFWDCLVDADLANNSASWQWIAGCGADAAPYFRIFNPITQGEKFDKTGEYTRRFIPELKDMPDKYLYKPWEAPDDVLQNAGVELGRTYPKPVVNLKGSRERALEAFKSLKVEA